MFRSAKVPKHDEKNPLILQNTSSLITRAKNTQSILRTFYDGDSRDTKQQIYNVEIHE